MLFTTQSDVSKLLDIAQVAHKYSFKTLESWACDALELWANKMSRSELESSYKAHLQNVIHVARLCHHDRLLATIVSVLQQLMHSSPAYLTLALTLADELEMDTLTGAAYYAMLLKGEQFWNDEARLTARQRLRLLNGYYRLTNEWERYRNTVPAYAHAQSCGVTWSQGQCRMSWDDFWKKQVVSERVMKANLADVVGRLKSVMREMDRWGPWGQVRLVYALPQPPIFIFLYQSTLMHHECRQEIKKTMLAEIKLFEQKLASYFPPILD